MSKHNEILKVGILMISTSEYNKFHFALKNSIFDYFLRDYNKHLFWFTDDEKSNTTEDETVIKITHLPMPLNSLLRFHYFKGIDLESYDLIYYIDIDCLIVSEIGNEINPTIEDLVAVKHPLIRPVENHFEKNNISMACVEDNIPRQYFQACFFGGKSHAMIELINELECNIRLDLRKNFIAKWYDESHINKYFIAHPPKALDFCYAFPNPERWPNFTIDGVPKIIHYNHTSS